MTDANFAIALSKAEAPIPERIYLDHAATTPIRPEALAAMQEGFAIWANPSSPHAEGRKAKQALEDARDRLKKALDWDGEVIFTSGASEALWIALNRAKVDRRIVSAVEHDAVFRAAPDAAVVPIGKNWSVDQAKLADQLSGDGKPIVAIQHLNPETGIIQPVADLAKQVREAGGFLVSDCSQSAGKLNLPDADMLVVSGHKFGGPIGIGLLLVKEYGMLKPIGGHERGYRQGTENLPAVAGLAAALELNGLESWKNSDLDRLECTLLSYPDLHATERNCDYIYAYTHKSMSAQAQLIRLDSAGLAVSAGSACSSGTLKPSRVLKAFGLTDEEAARTIRVSIGWSTTQEDIYNFYSVFFGL